MTSKSHRKVILYSAHRARDSLFQRSGEFLQRHNLVQAANAFQLAESNNDGENACIFYKPRCSETPQRSDAKRLHRWVHQGGAKILLISKVKIILPYFETWCCDHNGSLFCAQTRLFLSCATPSTELCLAGRRYWRTGLKKAFRRRITRLKTRFWTKREELTGERSLFGQALISNRTDSGTRYQENNNVYSLFLFSAFQRPNSCYWRKWACWYSLEKVILIPYSRRFFENSSKIYTFSVEKVETFLELPHLVNQSEFYFNSTRGFYCMNNGKGPGRPKCLNKVLFFSIFRGLSAKLRDETDPCVVAPPT